MESQKNNRYVFEVKLQSSKVLIENGMIVKEIKYKNNIPVLILRDLLCNSGIPDGWGTYKCSERSANGTVTHKCIYCQEEIINGGRYYYKTETDQSSHFPTEEKGIMIHTGCSKKLLDEISEFIKENKITIVSNLI